MDLIGRDAAILRDNVATKLLPPELFQIIQQSSTSEYLAALSAAALDPRATETIFCYYEPIFADICARWDVQGGSLPVVTAFAKVLPLAPHLSGWAKRQILGKPTSAFRRAFAGDGQYGTTLPDDQLMELLLATFRLLVFDNQLFAKGLTPTTILPLIGHGSRAIRCLAIRILCLYLHSADFSVQRMLSRYVGKEVVSGSWEGKEIDYTFLSLWEERRLANLATELKKKAKIQKSELNISGKGRLIQRTDLSSSAAEVCGVLLPRAGETPSTISGVVRTETTTKNLRQLAEAMTTSSHILISGLSGAGKTALINDIARELNVTSTMVTLHLNEQTDAKLLIGMYTTASTPGSFAWREGVLTTAVRQGRWVLIEDLDRAPTEVMSVILPLIERNELLIPSRGESVHAASGFRLIATMRTSLNSRGDEITASTRILGYRFWKQVTFQSPTDEEFRSIADSIFPLLRAYSPKVMGIYSRLRSVYRSASFVGTSKSALSRPLNPRDFLKCCRRLNKLLVKSSSINGEEPLPENVLNDMFMELVDCFAGSLDSDHARRAVFEVIAEEMHIPPQRVEYFLHSYTPKFDDSQKLLTVGRASLRKRKLQGESARIRNKHRSRPYANNSHALRLLERVGIAVEGAEPVLLVGETGTGKTTAVQRLADALNRRLHVINLSQQSESGDLLGGFKPLNLRSLALPLKEEFEDLFELSFPSKKNQKFIDAIAKSVAKAQWTRASKLWNEAMKTVNDTVKTWSLASMSQSENIELEAQPIKRRKVHAPLPGHLQSRWDRFTSDLERFNLHISTGTKGYAFTYVEGNMIKAVRNGDWVLLDEINLASPDTLESIADLLSSGEGDPPSILLSETGNIERVVAHPDFRMFGAMNPATDIGKKDLPSGLRSRFTEIYVDSPDRHFDNLSTLVRAYLGELDNQDERVSSDVSHLYMEIKHLENDNRLVDGTKEKPHFSLRTLTRTLSFVVEITSLYGLRRALYEGFSMSFLTLLDKESIRIVTPLLDKLLLGSAQKVRSTLNQVPNVPQDGREYVQFRHYWVPRGPLPLEDQPHYVVTPSIESNLLNLVRATLIRRFPVLIQGPTSAGKTSMIEYLAKRTGHNFVRINNHEHTDLQEYLGSYISDNTGQLKFQEGILVQALRAGHWIVLDELNLAPTDVLEALNRLLDDNRELVIPETQEVVHPHPDFMLFATQNPAGLYGGRKILSRAFRNRFLELHFDDIPEAELETILRERSQIAPSFSTRIVSVYKELSLLRQTNRLFEQKNSFATLRDLFRWALRGADDREQLAANGFMLLAERVRKPEERLAVKEIIERVMKVKLDADMLYSIDRSPEMRLLETRASGIVWTKAMRRLFVLVSQSIRHNEPVLLVGETGCGKTSVCQMLAQAFGKQLHIVNAHQNLETGDLIGAQRPVRNRAAIEKQVLHDLKQALSSLNITVGHGSHDLDDLLEIYDQRHVRDNDSCPANIRSRIEVNRLRLKALFEWSDGSLVQAMKDGQYFLLDEISLADDSVLERLNSALEPQRTLLLAEKGPVGSLVIANDGFQFLATMNPGGDYGKRELSPALRNRFTEIWVPPLSDHSDVQLIAGAKLEPSLSGFADGIVQFAQWFAQTYNYTANTTISIRDVLSWVEFVNRTAKNGPLFAAVHGAAMVYIDTLGANPAAMLGISSDRVEYERTRCFRKLSEIFGTDITTIYNDNPDINIESSKFSIGQFSLNRVGDSMEDESFNFRAPTTKQNGMRILRALALEKPILLEGNPGVGKTTLVSALAQAVGKHLVRINLSEQTDLMDLFGSDVPVEGESAGHFAWRDAPFLQAMQRGDWVLLDEMNLASQSVLEGLNSCLDHRGEVYITELDQSFKRHPNFTVFAAQNPHHQGGGRKGLPASFVNRFTVVFADMFTSQDLFSICSQAFSDIPHTQIRDLIRFVTALEKTVIQDRGFGSAGAPWEFNLRDIFRWLNLLSSKDALMVAGEPSDYLDTVFRQRFRTLDDRLHLERIYREVFGQDIKARNLFYNLSCVSFQVGRATLQRGLTLCHLPKPVPFDHKTCLPILESLMTCIQNNWPVLLVGPSGTGKTTLIKYLASLQGSTLVEFSLNADVDAMDLVGGFDQIDPHRLNIRFFDDMQLFLRNQITKTFITGESTSELMSLLEELDVLVQSKDGLERICQVLRSFMSKYNDVEIIDLVKRCQKIIEQPDSVTEAQFEWVDGILITALEKGHWLVLDNANLCSSSVLDRLNSLLEPNGFLNVVEHRTADGSARVVRPHPDFRIFLTMDPRHGELSRAMRNRAIELYMLPHNEHQQKSSKLPICFELESSMFRFRYIVDIVDQNSDLPETNSVLQAALAHLSLSDSQLVARFSDQMNVGLITVPEGFLVSLSQAVKLYETHLSQLALEDGGVLSSYDVIVRERKLSSDFRDSQPLHPLVNEILLNLKLDSLPSSYMSWLGRRQDLLLDLWPMRQVYSTVEAASLTLKPSEMNRLERSFNSSRVQRFTKDSTSNLASFLSMVQEAILSTLKMTPSDSSSREISLTWIRGIMIFWWSLFKLAMSKDFQDSTFQAYLMIGRERCSDSTDIAHPMRHLRCLLETQFTVFKMSMQLKTGLSMELMWPHLRPQTPTSLHQLDISLQAEVLADRFDSLIWTSRAPLAELVKIRRSLIETLHYIVSKSGNHDGVMTELEQAISNLESTTVSRTAVLPYFQAEFEGILQHLDLIAPADHDDLPAILAGRSTRKAVLQRSMTSSIQNIFAAGGDYSGSSEIQSQHLLALRGSTPISAAKRVIDVGDVTLEQLELLQAEIPTFCSAMFENSHAFSYNQLNLLRHTLARIMSEIFTWHADFWVSDALQATLEFLEFDPAYCSGLGSSITLKEGLPDDHYFRRISGAWFQPALNSLSASAINSGIEQLKECASAWIYFTIGCLLLYVPDKEFDPALKFFVERNLYEEEVNALHYQLNGLKAFEAIFTGQQTNYRAQLLENDIESLGLEPKVPAVVRPSESGIKELNGEFINLLQSVLKPICEANAIQTILTSTDGFKQADLHVENIRQIRQRLTDGFRNYDDLTQPVGWMLQSLEMGFTLIRLGQSSNTSGTNLPGLLIPFINGKPDKVFRMRDENHHETTATSDGLSYLRTISALVDVTESTSIAKNQRRIVFETFGSLFESWKSTLEIKQSEMEEKSRFYHYKGGDEYQDENDQAELAELFPTFENSLNSGPGDSTSDPAVDPKKHAIELSEIQDALFRRQDGMAPTFLALLESSITKAANLYHRDDMKILSYTPDSYLSGLLLVLDHRSAELSSSQLSSSYNFYTDQNLIEAKRLISFVRKTEARFIRLKARWPEHATLQDVLNVCKELLQFRHIEPVAKFLTKSEKLHAFIHEWQTVASREYSVAEIYAELTDMLISWRRLELSTWARLFDLEQMKVENDAKSWWFIAYEAIIAGPLSLSDTNVSLHEHGQELLSTLENFFSSATLAQFSPRMRLLRSFQSHVSVLAHDVRSMTTILEALGNFIAFYSRYEVPVKEALTKGRQVLEKEMKEVLLLASWKDTNIAALRDSAKRSHHKLFKLVRKYRALLHEPVESILCNGLPEAVNLQYSDTSASVLHVVDGVDRRAIELCSSYLETWRIRAPRLVNVNHTIALMVEIFNKHEVPNVSNRIESFCNNLVEEMNELQKQTPSLSTEDNKDALKHLKTRKRKLFADTLREVRQMGFRANVGQNLLAKQDTLSKVLSQIKPLGHSLNSYYQDLEGAEYYLHKSLDQMPQVRKATREHCDELNGAEVIRSVGYLEDMLSIVMDQRNRVLAASDALLKLDKMTAKFSSIWQPEKLEVQRSPHHFSVIREHLSYVSNWLATILESSVVLSQKHARLTQKSDHPVTQLLISATSKIKELVTQWEIQPSLSQGLVTSSELQLAERTKQDLNDLRQALNDWIDQYPDVGYILRQVVQWTEYQEPHQIEEDTLKEATNLNDLDQTMSQMCDSILVAVQRLQQTMLVLSFQESDEAWLRKYEVGMKQLLHPTHLQQIQNGLADAFCCLSSLESLQREGQPIAAAICSVALPIIRQYVAICSQLILRQASCHRSLCKMNYILAKSFNQIATQGFCTPPEKSKGEETGTEKLEGGTGLGEGEGAEDISKDIQDDEDLSELAQEPNKDRDKNDMENQEDAVNMDDDVLEGQMDDPQDQGSNADAEEKEENDGTLDEETGQVDDLDPSAVDEKTWEGDKDEEERDKEGDKADGKSKSEEQVAGKDNPDQEEAEVGDENSEDAGAEEGEDVQQQDTDMTDPHAQEEGKLDLPDNIDLDGDKDDRSGNDDDGMDELSDMEEDTFEDNQDTKTDAEYGEDTQNEEDQEISEPNQAGEEQEQAQEQEQEPDQVDPEAMEEEAAEAADTNLLPNDATDSAMNDEDTVSAEDTAPGGTTEQADRTESMDQQQVSQDLQGDPSNAGDAKADAEQGERGKAAERSGPGTSQEDQQADPDDSQSFKKLGDLLEKWHRQQRQIQSAPEEQDEQKADQSAEPEQDMDFGHLKDEDDQADTQALGGATQEQARAVDYAKALEEEPEQLPEELVPDETLQQEDINMDDNFDMGPSNLDQNPHREPNQGAVIGQRKNADNDFFGSTAQEDEEDLTRVDSQLATVHIHGGERTQARSIEETRNLWAQYESSTRDLSLSLTEQLRLILAPTLATKMRGDFRTGKRLNIKRIIPYIASQYKRDKIWMRRSIPSKRSYQIMLAVDDSKSMAESGGGQLAFETLALVSKSLTMLEAGSICIVGFGDKVHVAHGFDQPMTSESGVAVFQQFGFEQVRTDVRRLVAESINLFLEARRTASSTSADLWQLELIISDGVCEDHETIRRLVRQAQEDRIMLVFIIVDALRGSSILDMSEAKFVSDEKGEMKLKMSRYLDNFPFPYYLVVANVKELPAVLAMALRQWFAEVVDSSG